MDFITEVISQEKDMRELYKHTFVAYSGFVQDSGTGRHKPKTKITAITNDMINSVRPIPTESRDKEYK